MRKSWCSMPQKSSVMRKREESAGFYVSKSSLQGIEIVWLFQAEGVYYMELGVYEAVEREGIVKIRG